MTSKNKIEKQHIQEISGVTPYIERKNSKFYNFFDSLTQEEQNFESFFNFNKEQLFEIINAYYEDLQTSFSSNQNNIVQHILNFIYTNLQEDLQILLKFEGTQIGIKEENFKINISRVEKSLNQNQSVIKITQNFNVDPKQQSIQSSDNQKFATFIEQADKVVELAQSIRGQTNDTVGETVIQLTAMIFILCDTIAQSQSSQHLYELQTQKGMLKVDIHQECLYFNLIDNISLTPKYKI